MEASELKQAMEQTPYWPIFPWLPMNRGHYTMLICKNCGEDITRPSHEELETQICEDCRRVARVSLKRELLRQAGDRIRAKMAKERDV